MRRTIRGFGILALSILAGCAGSPSWIENSSPATVQAYYADWSVRDLCSRWDEVAAYPVSQSRLVRGAISKELGRRGENPDQCYDADRDAFARAADAARPRTPVTVYQPPVYQPARPASVYTPAPLPTHSSRTYDTVRCDSRVRAGGDVKTVCR